MVSSTLVYLAGLLTVGWGVAHLFPTRNVVRGFGDISVENRHIITMEWITEGVALIFIGVLVSAVTFVDRSNSVSHAVYWITFGTLNILSLVSLFTGFRIPMLPFKLCPVVFTTASILIVLGGIVD